MTKLITPEFVLSVQNNNESPITIQVMARPIKFCGSIEFKASGFDELFRILAELGPFILAQGVEQLEFERIINSIKDRVQNQHDWNVTKALHSVDGLVIGIRQTTYTVNTEQQYHIEVERDGWVCKQTDPNQLPALLKSLTYLGIPLDGIIPLLAQIDVSEKNPCIYIPRSASMDAIKLFNL